MQVYKIVRDIHAHNLQARNKANRWNLKNELVIYTSSSRSLATLELLVSQAAIISSVVYKVLVISLDVTCFNVKEVNVLDLPDNWSRIMGYSMTQELGSSWYQDAKYPILKVPSVVIPAESNYIINTEHPQFKKIVQLDDTESFYWDT